MKLKSTPLDHSGILAVQMMYVAMIAMCQEWGSNPCAHCAVGSFAALAHCERSTFVYERTSRAR